MTAPLAPLDATVAWLDIATRGWGVVVVPPRYQRDVAEALAARVPGRPTIALSVEALDGDGPAGAGGGFLYVAPEVPYDGEVAIWRALNGRRDWLSDRGVWVVVLTTRQLERLATHAGDLASVARRCETVPFVPRQLSDDELVAARAELHAHYQRRFGRLDLRGFIRSEREDVSFPVEAIYQPLRASSDSRYPVVSVAPDPAAPRWLSIVDLLVGAARARSTRPAPGRGAAVADPPGRWPGQRQELLPAPLRDRGQRRRALRRAGAAAADLPGAGGAARADRRRRPGRPRRRRAPRGRAGGGSPRGQPRPRPGAPCSCSTGSTRWVTAAFALARAGRGDRVSLLQMCGRRDIQAKRVPGDRAGRHPRRRGRPR
jgi:hypothetical protein